MRDLRWPTGIVALALAAAFHAGPRAQAAVAARPARAETAMVTAPAPTPSVLVGTWMFDRSQTADNQDAWRRRVDAMRLADAPPASPNGPATNPAASRVAEGVESPNWILRSALRDLLEVAERLSFEVSDRAVTITDDLDRRLMFALTGDREKRMLAATEFQARTRWTGTALTQEITSATLKLTQVFLPSDDGRQMIVSIKVEKPVFQPALKDILRVYVRKP